jgi:hypothetical protein
VSRIVQQYLKATLEEIKDRFPVDLCTFHSYMGNPMGEEPIME